MDFEAVMIRSRQPLLVSIVSGISDHVRNAFEKASRFSGNPRLSGLRTKNSDDNPDDLFSSLASYPSLIRRICQGVSEIFSGDYSEPASEPAEAASCFGLLVTVNEDALPMRLFKAAEIALSQIDERSEFEPDATTAERAYADLPFLRQPASLRFPVRLVREAAEAARTFVSDPMALIKGLAARGEDPIGRKTRIRTGLGVAIVVYAVAFTFICGSYYISHRNRSRAKSTKRTEVTLLAVPPVSTAKPLLPLKQAGGGGNHLSLPEQSVEQPKPPAIKPSLEPRPLDQLQSNAPQPDVFRAGDAAGPSVTATGESDGSGTGGGAGSGHGPGVGAGNGAGIGTRESIDYNGVFSVGNVTVRPQILGRPTPGYTDEARRNQVEGAVKVSVLLNADGTVSDIKVARGLGYGLDEKAIEAAHQLRFVPAQKDGHAVSVRLFLEFKFSLV